MVFAFFLGKLRAITQGKAATAKSATMVDGWMEEPHFSE